jgi:hypothetical protein
MYNDNPIVCTIHGLRDHAVIVQPCPKPGYVSLALVGPAGRYGEAVTLPSAQCEELAQALALSLYGGGRALQ